jgi:hypothetical protein
MMMMMMMTMVHEYKRGTEEGLSQGEGKRKGIGR